MEQHSHSCSVKATAAAPALHAVDDYLQQHFSQYYSLFILLPQLLFHLFSPLLELELELLPDLTAFNQRSGGVMRALSSIGVQTAAVTECY